jgi:hypothetical protein
MAGGLVLLVWLLDWLIGEVTSRISAAALGSAMVWCVRLEALSRDVGEQALWARSTRSWPLAG